MTFLQESDQMKGDESNYPNLNIFLHIIHSSVSTLISEKIHPKKHCENGRHSD